MSADNGVYIAKFPKVDGGVEFRVAEASAIDNCTLFPLVGLDMEDAYRVLIFGDSSVFTDYSEAEAFAEQEAAKYDVLEYGIQILDFNRAFPTMSKEEALKIINTEL